VTTVRCDASSPPEAGTNSEGFYAEAPYARAVAGDFDFWVGEWNARWEGGNGSNTVTSELGGSVILERFDGRPGTTLQGLSVSVFDRERECWRQTWVDSHGGYLDFAGGVGDDGVMELRHVERKDDGSVVPFRMRFTEVERESFVWLWEREEAKGVWGERWRIQYTRRA
jgi:hypothetical protein